MGAVDDDRNFRGTFEDVVKLHGEIDAFDKSAGHMMEDDKTVFAATHPADLEYKKLCLPQTGSFL